MIQDFIELIKYMLTSTTKTVIVGLYLFIPVIYIANKTEKREDLKDSEKFSFVMFIGLLWVIINIVILYLFL